MKIQFKITITTLGLLFTTVGTYEVFAHENYVPVANPIILATTPIADVVPPIKRVPGKEYTDFVDRTHVPMNLHHPKPLQLGVFDGKGGVADGIDLGPFAPHLAGISIDAQSAVRNRFLFDPLVANEIPLVFSTSLDDMLAPQTDVAIVAETAAGGIQPFATVSDIVDHAHPLGELQDIASPNLWGIEGQTGTNVFSAARDPGETSVYFFDGISVKPYLSRSDIATAIGWPLFEPFINVDALLANDVGTGFNPFDGEFGPGDSIIFSINPIIEADGAVFFDGGEIFHWEYGSPAEFLEHGGHVWDTAFSVKNTFNTPSENIDALDMVTGPRRIVGDMDCDGDVDFDDIRHFVEKLTNPLKYEMEHGIPPSTKGDTDGDNDIDFDDISGFVRLLNGTGGGGIAAVPEPSALSLVALGLVGLWGYRRRRAM